MQPGLHEINLNRIKVATEVQSPIMISPPNHKFVFSPDLLLAQHHDNIESFGGLISPNFVGTAQKILMHDSDDE
jgi:hypothetical protein